ncbi:MAG TPA: DUF4139 domain-containing protein [Azospirillaceae bacterium]|nr:DUF4139 domain-containing protein [Azospirillaceae bacterium]
MRRLIPLALVLVATVAVPVHGADAQDLVLKRVLLSTGGVGYFEHEAEVDGDALLTLAVRRDQVDDVLKSLVVYDDRGGIGGVTLPGEAAPDDAFRDLPFGPEALEHPAILLNALRGAEVRVQGPTAMAGRILSAVPETSTAGGDATIVRHRVTLMGPDGLRSFLLEEADGLAFADAALTERFGRALAARVREAETGARRLAIATRGPGRRTVRVAYVVAAPLWKSTYRLTLDAAGGANGHGRLQGWAVLENMTGTDWPDVQLTLASGDPVTFRQAIYQAYYVKRPEVPVEVMGRILPPVDPGGVPVPAASAPTILPAPAAPAPGEFQGPAQGPTGGPEGAARAQAQDLAAPEAARSAMGDPTPAPAVIAAAEGQEAAAQVLFRLPAPITVPHGHSALVPLLDREVPAAPVAQFRSDIHPRHPFAAVRLRNTDPSGLPSGVLALYVRDAQGQVAYAGDARLGPLPSGEERMLGFALDTRLAVERNDFGEETVTGGTIVDGVLRLTALERMRTTYTIKGAANEARRVVIEHPRLDGWELSAGGTEPGTGPDDAVQTIPGHWRVARDVPAGQTVTLTLAAERPRSEDIALLGLSPEQVQAFASGRNLPEPVRQALARLAELQAEVVRNRRAVDEAEREMNAITADQERLRQNLAAVPKDGDLARRYLGQLRQQEDRLDALRRTQANARTATDAARARLEDYVRGLKL